MVRSFSAILASCLVVAVVVVTGWALRQERASPDEHATTAMPPQPPSRGETESVRISRPARENLGIESKPLKLSVYWRTVDLPGSIVERPGVSDRGVVSPIAGVVTSINRHPGDTVPCEAPLITIRLLSEPLHVAQMELFKASREIEIAQTQLARLSEAATSGALPKSRIIAIENEIKRLNAVVTAHEQALAARGLSANDIAAAARGDFVTEIVVCAPSTTTNSNDPATDGDIPTYEVQTLRVALGQQVEAGQVLVELTDHRKLFIEGRAFKDDMPLIQQAARHGWLVGVDFGRQGDGDWSSPPSHLPIHHVANTVDPDTRTFSFYLELENQWQNYSTPDGEIRQLWRFRPGGRVRLRVPFERIENVLIVPRAAVVWEGPEAFVFRQNGDLFDRRSVHVLCEDRLHVALANGGSVRPGFFIAQSGAASLNRILKAQRTSGTPANVHVHADGTVHEAH